MRLKPQIGAIILAAGTSTRMGSNKLLASLNGEALIRRVVRTVLASKARPILAVTGSAASEITEALGGVEIAIVNNPDFRQGMSTSLRAGVSALPETCAGALIVLGDMPAITSGLLDRMVAALDPGRGREICVATHAGRRGNPVLFGRRFFPDLLELTGDRGARQVVAKNEDAVVEVEADDDGPLIDIDTEDALADFLAQ